MSVFKHLRFLAALSILLSIAVAAESPLERLSPGQSLEGFKVANLYDNSVGKAMGARFISNKYGFIVDLITDSVGAAGVLLGQICPKMGQR